MKSRRSFTEETRLIQDRTFGTDETKHSFSFVIVLLKAWQEGNRMVMMLNNCQTDKFSTMLDRSTLEALCKQVEDYFSDLIE